MKLFLFLSMFILSSCMTGPQGPYVTRINADEQVDLSGYWNDTDSRLVSEKMMKDLLTRPWIDEFRAESGKRPTLVIGRVVNKSLEHIATETFVKDLERELVNSGEVRFVASHSQRDALGSEKMYQAKNASIDTQKAMGRELGADFIVLGQINSIEDRAGSFAVRYYQIELELVNIATGEKVWMGQKKIKKVLERDEWS